MSSKANRMKYKSLSELAQGFKNGELKDYVLILDNDWTGLRYSAKKPDDMSEEDWDIHCDTMSDAASNLYRGNGYSDLGEAMAAAGIPYEWC